MTFDNFGKMGRSPVKKSSECIIERIGKDGKEIKYDQIENDEDLGIVGGFINFLSKNFGCG